MASCQLRDNYFDGHGFHICTNETHSIRFLQNQAYCEAFCLPCSFLLSASRTIIGAEECNKLVLPVIVQASFEKSRYVVQESLQAVDDKFENVLPEGDILKGELENFI